MSDNNNNNNNVDDTTKGDKRMKASIIRYRENPFTGDGEYYCSRHNHWLNKDKFQQYKDGEVYKVCIKCNNQTKRKYDAKNTYIIARNKAEADTKQQNIINHLNTNTISNKKCRASYCQKVKPIQEFSNYLNGKSFLQCNSCRAYSIKYKSNKLNYKRRRINVGVHK
jgi:hypothetical protein